MVLFKHSTCVCWCHFEPYYMISSWSSLIHCCVYMFFLFSLWCEVDGIEPTLKFLYTNTHKRTHANSVHAIFPFVLIADFGTAQICIFLWFSFYDSMTYLLFLVVSMIFLLIDFCVCGNNGNFWNFSLTKVNPHEMTSYLYVDPFIMAWIKIKMRKILLIVIYGKDYMAMHVYNSSSALHHLI